MTSSRLPTIRRRQGFFDGLPLIWLMVFGLAAWVPILAALRSAGVI